MIMRWRESAGGGRERQIALGDEKDQSTFYTYTHTHI
jgi:hypothetical protein